MFECLKEVARYFCCPAYLQGRLMVAGENIFGGYD